MAGDAVWKGLLSRVLKLKHARVEVGVFADGGEEGDGGATVADIFAAHEFGNPATNLPARRPMRTTIAKAKPWLEPFTATLSEKVLAGSVTETRALELLGARFAGELKKTIMRGPHLPPPLKQATIDRKGSDRPLVDTAQMVNAIEFKVVA